MIVESEIVVQIEKDQAVEIEVAEEEVVREKIKKLLLVKFNVELSQKY